MTGGAMDERGHDGRSDGGRALMLYDGLCGVATVPCNGSSSATRPIASASPHSSLP